MSNIVIIIICTLLILLGLIGLVIPVFPGVILVFGGILLYALFTHFSTISLTTIVILGILVMVNFIISQLLGIYTAKKFGATKYGIYGGLLGILVGLLFAPFGLISVIICPVLGTIIGEVIAGKKISDSSKVGLGTLIGYFIGILLDITLTAVMIYIFLKAVL